LRGTPPWGRGKRKKPPSSSSFFVNLSNPINATLADGLGLGVIDDDDGPTDLVAFSSSVFSVNEDAGTATVTVTRLSHSFNSVTVNYSTSDGTAGPLDYSPASGTLSFNGLERSKSFGIKIANDALNEAGETIKVNLSNPTGAGLGPLASATVVIMDNDPPPALSINDVSVAEGNGGTTSALMTVSLSGASAQAAGSRLPSDSAVSGLGRSRPVISNSKTSSSSWPPPTSRPSKVGSHAYSGRYRTTCAFLCSLRSTMAKKELLNLSISI
jgi:hypothetical protein